MKWLIGAGVAVVVLTGCGSSSRQAGRTHGTPSATPIARANGQRAGTQARFLQTCANPDAQYLTMAKDFVRAATSFSAGGGSASGGALGQVIADVDTYETDLALLRPHANAGQQAQIDHYDDVLNSLKTGAQDASAGDDQPGWEAWTGIGRQIAKVPALVGSICNV